MTVHLTAMPDVRPARDTPGHGVAQRLRVETRPEHDAIEANPRMARLMAPDLRRAEYVTLLERLLGYYEPVEARLRDLADAFPAALEADARLSKAGLLRADLAALGAAIDVPQVGTPLLPAESPEAVWGCLYVMEGSTMGGQIIARALAASIDVHPARGGSFHVPYGPLTGARWQTFRALLGQQVDDCGLDADAIVAGAKATFSAMNTWIAA